MEYYNINIPNKNIITCKWISKKQHLGKELIVDNLKIFSKFDERRNAVKEYAKNKNIPLWKIAADMGVNDGNLSRKLRTLSAEQEQDMYSRIDKLAAEDGD